MLLTLLIYTSILKSIKETIRWIYSKKTLDILETIYNNNLIKGVNIMKDIQMITIKASVNSPVERVWKYWTEPEHIKKWNSASEDWHTPYAENDLRVGGKFLSRMEAKDGSFGFDFGGIYDEVEQYKVIAYTLGDGRKVRIDFTDRDNSTEVSVAFEAESSNPIEMQQSGWQAILENFKKYVEQY